MRRLSKPGGFGFASHVVDQVGAAVMALRVFYVQRRLDRAAAGFGIFRTGQPLGRQLPGPLTAVQPFDEIVTQRREVRG